MAEVRRGAQLEQLNRLAEALRSFGLTDAFEIGELLTGGAAPAVNVIERRLARNRERLPDGISPRTIAEHIGEELRRLAPRVLDSSERPVLFDQQSDPLTSAELTHLKKIHRGAEAASDYVRRVGRILGTVYREELVDGKLEVEITGGRRRVDIVFRNVAFEGFFAEIQTVHSIEAPRVWIECKNYSKDLGNPEVDQIGGRLGQNQGMFGILSCRSIKDQKLLAARTADVRNRDRKWIVLVTDGDWIEMGQSFLDGDRAGADAVLRRRFQELLYA